MRIQMEISRRTPQIILNFLFLFILINLSYQNLHNDTIFQGEEIRDWQQLRSQNNLFTLQFFSPTETNKEHRYLAIFYNIQPGNLPIWIANRDTPISDASGSLKIDNNGTLKISYGAGNSIILGSSQTSRNSSATLLDNGNLVFSILNFDRSVNQTIWQSYDHGTDTLVPGMRLGINSRTGQNWNLTTSISDQIPGSVSGSFSLGLDPNGTAAQLMIWYKGKVLWRSGIWTNGTFSCSNHESLHFRYISNQEEKYFEYVLNENPSLMRYKFEIFSWITKRGLQVKPSGWDFSKDGCDYYENNMMLLPKCGKHVFSFESRLGYVFGKSVTFEDIKISLFDCQVICVQNCSCLAYASISENGTGCEIWYKGMKFQTTSDTRAPSREVFIRSDTIKGYSSTKWWPWMVLGVILLVSLCTLYFVVRKLRARVFQLGRRKRSKNFLLAVLGSKSRNGELHTNMSQDVHLFSFDSIVTATDNFLTTNKLGEGGFGSVFKGNLLDGQEVAIKRLSRYSTQGLVEFKNEIQLIAKLQHNNLVRLLGCCIQEDEKILVYEYMTNKSLDFLLFSEDPNKKAILKWSVRINIIEGIAQGLLYLHKYSRLRVIHRDLKASNILLDGKMNPKISDFGLARIFGIQQSEANTKRIVGTYGYMSPEYAMKGVVSMKSDVFSFGVLLLEIISGKKNNSCSNSDYPFNLVGHAWEMWKEGRDLELMDPTLDDDDSMNGNEVKRCIHIGLLCVQDHAMDRPFMSAVVSMLTNETTSLPVPKEPAFFIGKSERILEICSTIDRSISVVEPR